MKMSVCFADFVDPACLYFRLIPRLVDGTCPNDRILKKFMDAVDATPGAVAVHCKVFDY
jgi:hypothetical protein